MRQASISTAPTDALILSSRIEAATCIGE